VGDVAGRGDDGLHLARSTAFDLVILDVMPSGLDGRAVITAMRQGGSRRRCCSSPHRMP